MKISIIKKIFFILNVSMFFLFLIGFVSYAEIKTIEIGSMSYSQKKGEDWIKVEEMPFGKKTLGKFYITGDMSNDSFSFGGTTCYGVESGNIKFSYEYDGLLLEQDVNKWHILDDKENIKKGYVEIYKSFDKDNWYSPINPLVNFYGSNPKGKDNLYTTSGEDINKGYYYSIGFAYSIGKGESSLFGTGLFKHPTEKIDCNEIFEFYLCNNNGTISIHNLSADVATVSEAEYSLEVLKAGETLKDGATTYGGFKIDKIGVSSYKVFVNGNEVEDGTEFIENGEYEILTKTQFGKEVKNLVYIYKDDSNGLNTYFDENFVVGKRVFRDGDIPAYDKNTKIKLKSVSNEIPYIRGIVKDLRTDEIIYEIDNSERKEWIQDLKAGSYQADLYNGMLESGSMYHYIYKFNIIDEDAKPYVNYNKLSTREELRDFNSKHYEVAYQTTRGGYIYVCFLTEEEAFDYAYEIEKRFIEVKSDGIYYRDKENSNTKVRQNIENDLDKIILTKKVNEYARKNVEVAYFNPLEQFTYQTYANEEDSLKNLETLSISESIKIFPSQEVKERLFSRVPYANNFELMNVADYDVVSATAINKETQDSIDLLFNQKLDEQLEGQVEYEIIEKNKYGDENRYDVLYVNENTTKAKWNFIRDDKNSLEEITQNENEIVYDVDYAILSEQKNPYDDCALIQISCKDVYDKELTCQLSEIKNLCLYKKGNYKITYIDRNNNSFYIYVNVNGVDKNSIENYSKLNSISDIYNKIHINVKMEE